MGRIQATLRVTASLSNHNSEKDEHDRRVWQTFARRVDQLLRDPELDELAVSFVADPEPDTEPVVAEEETAGRAAYRPAPRSYAQVVSLAADPDFARTRAGMQIDLEAARVALRVVEDTLVDLRDAGLSVIPAPAHGLVIRSADSPAPSPIVRLTTAEALDIAVRAYLAAQAWAAAAAPLPEQTAE